MFIFTCFQCDYTKQASPSLIQKMIVCNNHVDLELLLRKAMSSDIEASKK